MRIPITVTIYVDIPDSEAPQRPVAALSPSLVTPTADDVPWPAETLPEMAAQFEIKSTQCPVHHVPWKVVPAGTSKKTGKPYSAFQACPEFGCEQRPAA